MIFHCPACSAGHTVPVSMIPNGGMDMTCRRCSESFLIDVDEPAVVEEEDPTVAARAEATAIGVANPYDELVPGAQLISPAGELVGPHDSSDDTEAIVAADEDPSALADKPTIPIDHRRVPLGPDEVGVDPEIDNTQRFDVEEEDVPTYEPDVIGVDVIESRGLGSSRPPSRRAPTPAPRKVGGASSSSTSTRPPFDRDDLYAKVASGRYEKPEPPPEPAPDAPRERAWNEPSSLILTGAGPTSAVRRFADWLNRAPLPLKVALIVFPVTLGITLVLTAGPKRSAPVEVNTASMDSVESTPAKSPDPDLDPDPEPDPETGPESAPDPGPDFDRPAAEGQAYVQAPKTRLRSRAAPKARTVARLAAGQLVRRYDERGDFALVLVEPDGPVGFVAERSLGAQKPIVALADDLAFAGCDLEGRTLDTCLFEAKQQEGTCLDRCGAGSDPSAVRCREACQIAFDRCARGCQPPKRRRRRRR